MSFRFWDALKYVDEVVSVMTAAASYVSHKDEGRLADDITRAILSAVRDTVGDPSAKVDEEKVRKAVVSVIGELQHLF